MRDCDEDLILIERIKVLGLIPRKYFSVYTSGRVYFTEWVDGDGRLYFRSIERDVVIPWERKVLKKEKAI